jgi:hypothetical protein
MKSTVQQSQQPTVNNENQCTYEVPAIIYEGTITTRAGSPTGGGDGGAGVDPADLFGNN